MAATQPSVETVEASCLAALAAGVLAPTTWLIDDAGSYVQAKDASGPLLDHAHMTLFKMEGGAAFDATAAFVLSCDLELRGEEPTPAMIEASQIAAKLVGRLHPDTWVQVGSAHHLVSKLVQYELLDLLDVAHAQLLGLTVSESAAASDALCD